MRIKIKKNWSMDTRIEKLMKSANTNTKHLSSLQTYRIPTFFRIYFVGNQATTENERIEDDESAMT